MYRLTILLAAFLLLTLAPIGCRSSRSGPAPGSPAAPSDLGAVLVQSSGGYFARLQWRDRSDDETTFIVRGRGGFQDWHDIEELPANTVDWISSRLIQGQTYTYVVYARNDKGQSPTSNRAEVTPPRPPGGGGGGSCGIIVSESGLATTAAAPPPPSLCLFRPGPTVWVDDLQPFGAAGGEVRLRGADGDTVVARITRRLDHELVVLDALVSWHRPPPVDDWEICFAIHADPVVDVRTLVQRDGLAGWTPRRVPSPIAARFPILAEQDHRLQVVVDPVGRTFTVTLDGLLIARQVPLDCILVMPARVLR